MKCVVFCVMFGGCDVTQNINFMCTKSNFVFNVIFLDVGACY